MKIYYFIVILLLFNCKTNTATKPVLKQLKTDKPVTLHIDNSTNNISVVEIPIQVLLENSTSKPYDLIIYNYHYGNTYGGAKPLLYEAKDKTLKIFNFSKNNTIRSGESKKLLLKTQHYIDTLKFSRDYFKKLIDNGNEDVIVIENLDTFKSKYPKLFEDLLVSDSLSLKFFDEPRVFTPIR